MNGWAHCYFSGDDHVPYVSVAAVAALGHWMEEEEEEEEDYDDAPVDDQHEGECEEVLETLVAV